MKTLAALAGVSGHTGDDSFKKIVTTALDTDRVELVDEEEESGFQNDFITSIYLDKQTDERFELYYGVRTPLTPIGVELPFTFYPTTQT